MTDCQFLQELVLCLTLIWPAQVTLGDVGSEISVPIGLVLAHKSGLAWPPFLVLDFLRWWGWLWWCWCWWRLLGSEGLAGLHMGLGISVRWALDGKHTNRSAEGAAFPSLPFIFSLLLLTSSILCFISCPSDLALAQLYGFGC